MISPVTDPAIVAAYLTDASNVHGRADGVLRPRTAEEVAEILREAQKRAIPVTVVAGRTSTTAGAVPEGGWVLSMEHLRAIGAIGEACTAEGGANLGEFQDAIERAGRFYPPDPTSRRDCSLGASIACNASGARTFKYGPTRPWITALQVVLPTGEIREIARGEPIPADWPAPRWTEPRVKTAAGYHPGGTLLDLFIGQEGTLGVITRATVRTIALPSAVLGFLCFFPSRGAALDFVHLARTAARGDRGGALSPRCLEYLDAGCVGLARARMSVPEGAAAALFCEQEVEPSVGEEAHLEAWIEALGATGALVDDTVVTTDDAGREQLHRFRHAVPAGINEIVVRNGMPKVGTDLSVPDEALDAMMDRYEHPPVASVLFGHVGDNHLHLNLLPKTAEELQLAKTYYDALAREAIAFGGSVSAEHGIGKLKKRQLGWMVGEGTLASFRALKRHLDPNWILGRGNLIDP